MWEAKAEYDEGTVYECMYCSGSAGYISEEQERHALEAMLLDKHPGGIWYSVNWINE